jgi:hypothetical protein
MIRRLRIISFLGAIGCFAASAAISYLGFELWPPSATLADGRSIPFKSAEVEACVIARGLTWLGDRNGNANWRACRTICCGITPWAASSFGSGA